MTVLPQGFGGNVHPGLAIEAHSAISSLAILSPSSAKRYRSSTGLPGKSPATRAVTMAQGRVSSDRLGAITLPGARPTPDLGRAATVVASGQRGRQTLVLTRSNEPVTLLTGAHKGIGFEVAREIPTSRDISGKLRQLT